VLARDCRPNVFASQTVSLKTTAGAEITALDINQDRTRAILAGRDILQTIRVEGSSPPAEETNIRAAIINNDRLNTTRHRDTLDFHDVKWSHGEYSSHIATAATNGKVIIYDLGRPGIEVCRLHEHSRQVHRVAFNPFQGYLLLSASQDGTVKLWDLRDARSEVSKWHSKRKYNGQSDGIRDVKWSPRDAVEFAFGTDGGMVQMWDYRNNKAAKLRINAHERHCRSIDWHPDGKHLLSAGQDRMVKIWDFESERRQKPAWTVRTPYPIQNARWRPPSWSEEGGGRWQCTQIATSYERTYLATVHLWDFRRPHIPFREISHWMYAPTDMLWHSQRLLWTVSREGQFYQTDIQYSPKVIDRRPMQAFAVSPTGEICVFSQRRARRPPVDYSHSSFVSVEGGTPEALSDKNELSRSLADDTLDDSFLSSSYGKRHHGRATSYRSNKSGGSTPPSFHDSDPKQVVQLSDSMSKKDLSFTPGQVAYRGMLDGTLNSLTFSYLAQKYKVSAIPASLSVSAFLNARKAFDQNAVYAQKTGAYRVAQTWRVLGSAVAEELMRRAVENKKRRLLTPTPDSPTKKRADISTDSPKRLGQVMRSPANPAHRAMQQNGNGNGNGNSFNSDSSSNLATPLARPHVGGSTPHPLSVETLPNPDQEEQLRLPPSVISKASQEASKSGRDAGSSKPLQSPVIDNPRLYPTANEINERKAQMSNWKAPPKVPLALDMPGGSNAINIPPQLGRHNSDDSFAMLSTSTDSQRGAFSIPASYNSIRSHRPSMSRIPELMDSAVQGDFMPPPLYLSTDKSSSTQSSNSRLPTNYSWIGTSSSFGMLDPMYPSGVESKLEDDQHMEASGTIVPDKDYRNGSGRDIDLKKFEREPFQISDFITAVENLDLHPATAQEMLMEVFNYYTEQRPSAQNIYHLTTLIKPFLTTAQTYSPKPTSLLTTQIRSSLTIPPLQETAVLSTYQTQLQSLQIFNPAASLARDAATRESDSEDLFRQTYSQTGFVCLSCNKPINNPLTKFRCENCREPQDMCPVCYQRYPGIEVRRQKSLKKQLNRQNSVVWSRTFSFSGRGETAAMMIESSKDVVVAATPIGDIGNDEDAMAEAVDLDDPTEMATTSSHPILWQSCMICGHGAHASCMAAVHNYPDNGGQCPTESCLCACVSGPYREIVQKEADEERLRAQQGSVSRDSRRASESRAVRSARSILEADGGVRRVRVVEPAKS
jgi:hypothetical protein